MSAKRNLQGFLRLFSQPGVAGPVGAVAKAFDRVVHQDPTVWAMEEIDALQGVGTNVAFLPDGDDIQYMAAPAAPWAAAAAAGGPSACIVHAAFGVLLAAGIAMLVAHLANGGDEPGDEDPEEPEDGPEDPEEPESPDGGGEAWASSASPFGSRELSVSDLVRLRNQLLGDVESVGS